MSWRCDGENDCDSGEDEENCGKKISVEWLVPETCFLKEGWAGEMSLSVKCRTRFSVTSLSAQLLAFDTCPNSLTSSRGNSPLLALVFLLGK